MTFPLCVQISSYKDTSQILLGPTIRAHLNHLFKGPISKYFHMQRYWRLRLQHMNGVGVGVGVGNSSVHNGWVLGLWNSVLALELRT